MTEAQFNSDTRHRLLRAAGEAFAEHGFRAATVREICAKAGANVAAVNYHFGDKRGLYRAALTHWAALAFEKYPPELGLRPGASARKRLEAFVRTFLLRLLDEGRPAWHGKLMAREMVDPTEALDDLCARIMGPLFGKLRAIVNDLCPGLDPDQVDRAAGSVVGQCLFYHHGRAVIQRLAPDLDVGQGAIEQLTDHIVAFTLGGLRGLKARGKQRRTARPQE